LEFSEAIFRKRILALLPTRVSHRDGNEDDRPGVNSSGRAATDLSGLWKISEDDRFLREAYRRILGRECDAVGFVNYLAMLHSHIPRRVVALHLINSPEARRTGACFTGVPESVSPRGGRAAFPSLGRIVSRLTARLRETVRWILYTPFETLGHKFDFVLRELVERTDRLSSKTDEALCTLSTKFDAYVADLQERHSQLRVVVETRFDTMIETHEEQLVRVCEPLNREITTITTERAEVAARMERGLDLIGGLRSEQSELRREQTQVQILVDQCCHRLALIESGQKKLLQQLDDVRALLSGIETAAVAVPARIEQGVDLIRGLCSDNSGLAREQAIIRAASDHDRGRLERIETDHKGLLAQLGAFQELTADSHNRMAHELAELRRHWHPPILSAGDRVLVTEVDGFIVGVPGGEWRLAAHHAFRGVLEPGTTSVFRSLVKPGMVVVDVGANIGMYTLHAARLLGGQGKVYSFEPTPLTFEILKDNVQVNGFLELGVIELRQAAVTDKAGIAKLAIFSNNSGHNTLFWGAEHGQWTEVRTVSLDQVLKALTHVDVVKIDAEGAEPLILRGMKETIARNPDIHILLEFAPEHLRRAGVEPAEFLDEISSLGFGFRRISEETGELMDTSRQDLDAVFSANLQLARDGQPSGGRR
jgi:FkbM family methyltransferase